MYYIYLTDNGKHSRYHRGTEAEAMHEFDRLREQVMWSGCGEWEIEVWQGKRTNPLSESIEYDGGNSGLYVPNYDCDYGVAL
jgi:hypothetical protein